MGQGLEISQRGLPTLARILALSQSGRKHSFALIFFASFFGTSQKRMLGMVQVPYL